MDPPAPDPAARLLTVVEAVAARAEEARRRLDELSATLDDLAGRVGEAGAEASAAVALSAPMRLVALELAVAGAGRAETAQRLRSQFPGQDATAVLDDVFG
jgi:hypothetical protein